MISLRFILYPQAYALATLPPDADHPAWARGRFTCVAHTRREVSVVCEQGAVPAGLRSQGDYRCLEIAGTFTLDAAGVVAAATIPLANAGISVFVVSAWSTDLLLVTGADLGAVLTALGDAGHVVA